MFDPSATDGTPIRGRSDASAEEQARALWSVPVGEPAGDPAETLVAELAAALRAVRGYVPHRVWWEEGPAKALMTYQALQEGVAT